MQSSGLYSRHLSGRAPDVNTFYAERSQPHRHRNLTRSPRFHSSHKIKTGHQYCDHENCVGAEPGVDPRSRESNAEYSHFKQSCVIDVIDYDAEEANFKRIGNDQFIHMMEKPKSVDDDEADPPLAVRWINIGGIDWDVLRAVALQYDLHSLALEDILHESGHNHSKADYYPEHLFIRILCHTLAPEYDIDEEELDHEAPLILESVSPVVGSSPEAAERGESPHPQFSKAISATSDNEDLRSSSTTASVGNVQALTKTNSNDREGSEPDMMKVENTTVFSDGSPPKKPKSKRRALFSSARNALRKRITSLSGFHSPARRELIVRIRELKREHRVNIRHQPLFIFLLRNGTVISIHPSPTLEYSAPITERLHQHDSVLRTSDDASLLVESLLDLVVDRILEVMDEYQVKIHDLEHKILMHPSMDTVRTLHILSGDLIMHRRTLEPIKTMIFGLRKYDLDRCIALADNLALAKQQQEQIEERRKHAKRPGKRGAKPTKTSSKVEAAVNLEPSHTNDLHRSDDDHLRSFMKTRAVQQGHPPGLDVQGYFSYKGKVYLADVYDHMDFALTSLDMFAGISENLINYAFNMASYEMNIVMNRLTIVSIIFLPLTLLTGYFGMNFNPFWAIDKNSDTFFWKIAIPMMSCLLPIFMFGEIKRLFTYIKRRWQDRRAVGLLLKELQNPNSHLYVDPTGA